MSVEEKLLELIPLPAGVDIVIIEYALDDLDTFLRKQGMGTITKKHKKAYKDRTGQIYCKECGEIGDYIMREIDPDRFVKYIHLKCEPYVRCWRDPEAKDLDG